MNSGNGNEKWYDVLIDGWENFTIHYNFIFEVYNLKDSVYLIKKGLLSFHYFKNYQILNDYNKYCLLSFFYYIFVKYHFTTFPL